MNLTIIAGRLAADPEVTYASQSQNAVAKFRIAADRGKKDGQDLGADFIPCVAFGKTAETIEKYVHKGDQIIINGRIHTDSYEYEGKKRYTWDVQVRAFEFGKSAKKEESHERFEDVAEDVPF